MELYCLPSPNLCMHQSGHAPRGGVVPGEGLSLGRGCPWGEVVPGEGLSLGRGCPWGGVVSVLLDQGSHPHPLVIAGQANM